MKFFRRRPRAGGVVFGDVVFVSSCRRVFRGYALCTRFSEIVGVLGRCGFCENRLASMRVRPASVRAGFFLLLVQEKETKEKDNPAVSPSAHPARKVRTRWPVAPTAHPCADGAMSAIHRAPPSGRFGHRPPPLKGPGKARRRAPARRSQGWRCRVGLSHVGRIKPRSGGSAIRGACGMTITPPARRHPPATATASTTRCPARAIATGSR